MQNNHFFFFFFFLSLVLNIVLTIKNNTPLLKWNFLNLYNALYEYVTRHIIFKGNFEFNSIILCLFK